jgi:hypothetical protein
MPRANGMPGQSCYGGTKGAQMRCRIELAEKHGCSYGSLGIQPPQYRMWFEDECTTFFTDVCPEDGNRGADDDEVRVSLDLMVAFVYASAK